jgi:hypothetical protein
MNDRWSHLNQYEKKYLKETMEAYDKIMEVTDDILKIANRYELNFKEIERAKNYAFGDGVKKHQFIPDLLMAEAWERMTSEKEIDIDEIFLKHEILESDLVINQKINQLEAHKIAQKQYPWSLLINKRNKKK